MTDLATRFYAGRYSEIISELIDTPSSQVLRGEDVAFVVGSLSFLSRTQEAETLLSMHENQMSDDALMEARYYLATSWRRMRTVESGRKSRQILLAMVRKIRAGQEADPRQLFFFYCGLAFYRYVDGRFVRSLEWAQRAYECAFKSGFPFGRLVAYDLMGHSQLMTGQVTAGFKNLSNSARLAENEGRGAIGQAVEVAQRLYRSTYGRIHASESLAELSSAIKSCEFENSYTLANLYLELARLQLLCGQGHLAEKSLHDAAESIYKLDVPFLDAQLNFRFAYVALLRMDYPKALNLIATAEKRARESLSESLRIVVLGLKHRILNESGQSDEAKSLEDELKVLAKRTDQLVSRRVQARLGWESPGPVNHGQDRLGDLLDSLSLRHVGGNASVISAGYLGLIPPIAGCRLFSRTIIFGFEGASVTVVDLGNVRHDPDGWPELVKRLVVLMFGQRKVSKEEITDYVWRQKYNPVRHDPLIYALVARLKKTLDSSQDWFFVEDGMYRLADGVQLCEYAPADEKSPSEKISVKGIDGLTLRQEKILELCRRQGSLTNKDVCREFQVSEITAGRDLAFLVEKGFLRRNGKGRATSYII